MKSLIVGHARHGKDTFAASLGVSFCSSSRFAAELFVHNTLKGWGFDYEDAEECYQDRFNHREMWHKLIAKYNCEDPTRLAREILKVNDLYVGMRAKREAEACLKAGLFDTVYWVDASDRLPPEGKESMNFGLDWLKSQCEVIVIDNNEYAPL